MRLYSPNGGVNPLSAVARLQKTVNTETIRRMDSDHTITLSTKLSARYRY